MTKYNFWDKISVISVHSFSGHNLKWPTSIPVHPYIQPQTCWWPQHTVSIIASVLFRWCNFLGCALEWLLSCNSSKQMEVVSNSWTDSPMNHLNCAITGTLIIRFFFASRETGNWQKKRGQNRVTEDLEQFWKRKKERKINQTILHLLWNKVREPHQCIFQAPQIWDRSLLMWCLKLFCLS